MQTTRFTRIPGMTLAVMRMLKGRNDARSHTPPGAPRTQTFHIPYERRTNMKRVSLWRIGIGLVITVGLLTVEPGYAEKKEHEPTCTLATLQGRYLSTFSGFLVPPTPGVTAQTPLAGAQVDIFNGDGTGTHQATVSVNGAIAQFRDALVSYTVNADCSGTITLKLPFGDVNSDMYIAPNGAEFVVVETDTGSIVANPARRVSRQ